MAADAGTITGPLFAGWLADSVSFSAAFAACAGVVFLAMIAAWRMPETLASRVTQVPTTSPTPTSPT